MDFSLSTFSDSFNSNVYRRRNSDTFAFAFLLATTSDKGIFPEILSHFREIDELTSEYITFISSKLIMNKSPNISMSNSEIMKVLQTGEFYNHWNNEYVDVTHEVNNFIENQTTESIKFARFCGIDVDKIPCIVFFSSLEEPNDYVIWQLKNMDSHNIIVDLRSIVAKFEIEYNIIMQLRSQIKILNDQIRDLKNQLEWRPNNYNSNVKFYKSKLGPIEQRIIKWSKKLDSAIKVSAFNKETTRIKRCKKKIKNAQNELDEVNNKVEESESILKKYITNGKQDIEDKIFIAKIEYEEIKLKLAETKIKPASEIIQSLDRKRFSLHIIKELGKAVPIFNLGLTGVKIFS